MLTACLEQIATPDAANHDEMLLGSLSALAGSANCRSVMPVFFYLFFCRMRVCHTLGYVCVCTALVEEKKKPCPSYTALAWLASFLPLSLASLFCLVSLRASAARAPVLPTLSQLAVPSASQDQVLLMCC